MSDQNRSEDEQYERDLQLSVHLGMVVDVTEHASNTLQKWIEMRGSNEEWRPPLIDLEVLIRELDAAVNMINRILEEQTEDPSPLLRPPHTHALKLGALILMPILKTATELYELSGGDPDEIFK